LLTRYVGRVERDTKDGDEVFADTHTSSTDQEKLPATYAIDCEDTGDSHTDVNDVGGDGDQERILDTSIREVKGTVVEDEVDTGELLPCLESHSAESTE
jgi:hypothetical protein